MNKKMNTTYIVRTGLLLALALIFQIGFKGQVIVGPMVNFVLIASTLTVGVLSGVVIGCFTPLIALLVGVIPSFLGPQIPAIIIGNSVLVVLFGLSNSWFKKTGEYIGLVLGSLLKFGILAISIRVIVYFLSDKIPIKAVPGVVATFSLPQLLNAIIGGVLAIIVVKLLPKSIILNNNKIEG